jgi:hypothetical protein
VLCSLARKAQELLHYPVHLLVVHDSMVCVRGLMTVARELSVVLLALEVPDGRNSSRHAPRVLPSWSKRPPRPRPCGRYTGTVDLPQPASVQ